MIIVDPYLSEIDVYPLTPADKRWIYNKVELCERLEQGPCGPVGTWLPPGDYCLRPIINIGGMARGGFRKVTFEDPRNILHNPPGYCLTPWTDALRQWRLYVDDECIHAQRCYKISHGIEYYTEDAELWPLHPLLRGISRYMLVESLGNTVIDVSPRHMVEEMREDVISDFRTIVRNYTPPEWGSYGIQPTMRRIERDGWTYLEEIEHDRLAG